MGGKADLVREVSKDVLLLILVDKRVFGQRPRILKEGKKSLSKM